MHPRAKRQAAVLVGLAVLLAGIVLGLDPFGLFAGGDPPPDPTATVEEAIPPTESGGVRPEGMVSTPDVPEAGTWPEFPATFTVDPWTEGGCPPPPPTPPLVLGPILLGRWVEFKHLPGQRFEVGDEVPGTDGRLYVLRRIDARAYTVTVMDEDGRVFTFGRGTVTIHPR